MTTLGKVYIGVCVTGAVIAGAVFTKVMCDITGIAEDVEEIKAGITKAKFDDDFDDLDEGDDDTEDVIAMMNAQNSAEAADPVQ